MRTQMEVNFWGVINVTRVALESMRKTGGGLIQQITSIGGQRGVPMFSIYCASKVHYDHACLGGNGTAEDESANTLV